MSLKRFNIRVYGILLNELEKVLVCDEMIKGEKYTKFPGGGLEFGEGLKDALIREYMEEAGIKVSVHEHIYTTDVFQQSAFDEEEQLISVYYVVKSKEWQNIKTSASRFEFRQGQNECFRWVPLSDLDKEEYLTLPLDKKVVEILKTLRLILSNMF